MGLDDLVVYVVAGLGAICCLLFSMACVAASVCAGMWAYYNWFA